MPRHDDPLAISRAEGWLLLLAESTTTNYYKKVMNKRVLICYVSSNSPMANLWAEIRPPISLSSSDAFLLFSLSSLIWQ